jgi:hypothetical protein
MLSAERTAALSASLPRPKSPRGYFTEVFRVMKCDGCVIFDIIDEECLGWTEISAWQEIRREHQGSDGHREEAS